MDYNFEKAYEKVCRESMRLVEDRIEKLYKGNLILVSDTIKILNMIVPEDNREEEVKDYAVSRLNEYLNNDRFVAICRVKENSDYVWKIKYSARDKSVEVLDYSVCFMLEEMLKCYAFCVTEEDEDCNCGCCCGHDYDCGCGWDRDGDYDDDYDEDDECLESDCYSCDCYDCPDNKIYSNNNYKYVDKYKAKNTKEENIDNIVKIINKPFVSMDKHVAKYFRNIYKHGFDYIYFITDFYSIEDEAGSWIATDSDEPENDDDWEETWRSLMIPFEVVDYLEEVVPNRMHYYVEIKENMISIKFNQGRYEFNKKVYGK